jgi:hypothetical protein
MTNATTSLKSMRRFGAVLAICFVGAPLAAAPLASNGLSFRTLTIGHKSLQVSKAYGADDEDCIFVTRHVPRPDGNLHPVKKLMCRDDA